MNAWTWAWMATMHIEEQNHLSLNHQHDSNYDMPFVVPPYNVLECLQR